MKRRISCIIAMLVMITASGCGSQKNVGMVDNSSNTTNTKPVDNMNTKAPTIVTKPTPSATKPKPPMTVTKPTAPATKPKTPMVSKPAPTKPIKPTKPITTERKTNNTDRNQQHQLTQQHLQNHQFKR